VLSDNRTGEVLARLLDDYDLVLVDCPPVLPVTDSTALSVWVDATLLVAKAEVTTRQTFQRAVETLLLGNAPLVGSILNDVQPVADYAYVASYYAPDGNGRRRRRGGTHEGGAEGDGSGDRVERIG